MELTVATRRVTLLGVAALCVVGCGRGQPARGDTAGAGVSTGAATGAGARVGAGTGERKPLCRRTGHWDSCLVKVRLEESGMVPQAGDPPSDLPQLGAAPVTYHIGKAAIALYIYPDTLARARAARGLDPAKFIAPSAALTMKGEATAIQNDNLLALLFSLNDQQRERVSDAFMAGPPQP